jgi:predicted dehydrogenase
MIANVTTNRVRCGIAGLGRIGSMLEDDRLREKPASHAGAIRANRDCLLVAGCDPREDRRSAFARRWGCRNVYPTLQEMLRAHELDILHVASPAETHLDLLRTAAAGRLPLVICEKPLAPGLPAAREALRLCSQSGTVLMVNHERRYSRDYLRARSLIGAGELGELVSITARLYMGRNRPITDLLWEDGGHLIDIIRFLTGAELEVQEAMGNLASRSAVAWVRFRSGPVSGILELSNRFQALVFELDLDLSRGRLRIGNGLFEAWRSEPSPYYEGFHSLKRARVEAFRTTGYFSGMLADAVAVLRHPGRRPVSAGEDGLAAVEAIDRILRLAGLSRFDRGTAGIPRRGGPGAARRR